MSTLDLDAFVARARAAVASTPPATVRETRAWLVAPFLETLGWDVDGDGCRTDVTVDGTRLEYVPAIDGVPALFVAVEPFGESLDRSRAVEVLETMAWTGVDRAIYTDGRDYLLLAGTTDADRLACRLPSLPDHEDVLAHYSRETVGQRLERHSREYVGRQLAVERPRLVDAIVAELTAATERGDAYRPEFESAADRFVERLVASFTDEPGHAALEGETGPDVSIEFSEIGFADAERDRSADRTDASTAAASDGHTESTDAEPDEIDASESTDAGSRRPDEPAGTARDPGDAGDGDSAADDIASTEWVVNDSGDGGSDPPGAEIGDPNDSAPARGGTEDGEYVVRFFNERGSIGAIGHSRSDQALVGAAEYLFDRGLSGVSVPWSPDEADDDRVVLNDSPTHADGTRMTAPHQLSNGLYLETAGDVEDRAARVEALVDRAGLRAMLTGDWG